MSLTFKQFIFLLPLLSGIGIMAEPALAQSIISAPDGTKTIVTPDGNRFDIHGGSLSGDGTNLFHSFEKFGLSQEQIANFLSNPQIQNILGRVVGGNPSLIDGLIQVTGGNSNLFLMNPSGFIFGNNAQLNVPASFTATTANGIKLGDRWFNASGMNDYATLVGNPSGFAFTMAQPSAIINAGDLAVNGQHTLALVAGTVASTGELSASEGKIVVTAVPGKSVVRLSMPGNVLGIEIDPIALGDSQPSEWNLPITALPDLLTVGKIEQDRGLAVNSQEQVTLANSATPITSGDVTVQQLSAQSAIVSANQNLTLVESQLNTTGNLQLLAEDTVKIRDSATKPFLAQAEGDLYIQGNQNIDILALNHPQTPFQSGGNLTLVSDGDISGDAHFASGGNFSLLNLKGEPGNFVSYYDPIITALGDVEFGNYTGVALKVEAIGSIEGGDIRITGPDTSLSGSDPDIPILTSSPALILRAGVSVFDLANRPNDPQSAGGTDFIASRQFSSSGAINVGRINTSSETGLGGTVILDAVGDVGSITVNGNIDSSSKVNQGGSIELTANGADSNILIRGGINTSSNSGNGGSIKVRTINGVGNVTVQGDVNTSARGGNTDTSTNPGQAGLIDIEARGRGANIQIGGIDTLSESGNGGKVDLVTIGSEADITIDNAITTQSNRGNGGMVNLSARGDNGNITVGEGITTLSQSSGQGGDISLKTDGNVGNISIGGEINASSLSSSSQRGGNVKLRALGNQASISVEGQINTRSEGNDGGDIALYTQGKDNLDGKIEIQGDLNTSSDGGDGGNIEVSASGNESAVASIFIGGDINTSSSVEPKVSEINDGEIIIDTSQTGNGGNVTLEALGDIELSRINTQGSNAFEFNQEQDDGSIFNLNLEPNLRIANGGDLIVNTRKAFRVISGFDPENETEQIVNRQEDVSSDLVSITTQGADNGNAIGGRIDIRIGEEQQLFIVSRDSTSTSSRIVGDITNSPVRNQNFVERDFNSSSSEDQSRVGQFISIEQGGGFPSGANSSISGGSNVSNAVNDPTGNVENNTSQDTISRQDPTTTPDNNNIDPTDPQSDVNPQQVTSSTPLEEQEEGLDDPCKNPEKFRIGNIVIEDPEIAQEIAQWLKEKQKLCQNQETEDTQTSSTIEEENEQI